MDFDGMNDAELTILSLLSEGDRYGHELQQLIEERGIRSWVAIGFSSIYYVLNKLERQQMVSAQLHQDANGVARKRFHLTSAGRGVLQTAVSDLLRQPRSLGDGFELGLANLHILKPAQVYQMLTHHRSDLAQRIRRVETLHAARQQTRADDPTDSRLALYAHSLTVMRAQLQWLDDFIVAWQTRYPAVTDSAASAGDVAAAGGSHAADTRIARRPTPDPAKQVQRLRRPKPSDPSGDLPPTSNDS